MQLTQRKKNKYEKFPAEQSYSKFRMGNFFVFVSYVLFTLLDTVFQKEYNKACDSKNWLKTRNTVDKV